MSRIVAVSSVHPTYDTRVYHNQAVSLAQAGHDVTLVIGSGKDEQTVEGVTIQALPRWKNRWHRIWVDLVCFFRLIGLRADAYHFHDPELLPIAVVLEKLFGRRCVYDVHEYYAEAILYKYWIPTLMRTRIARWVDHLEKASTKCLSGVITVNDDMRNRFCKYNQNVETVYNFPQPGYFSEFLSMESVGGTDPTVIYLGALGYERGLETLVSGMALLANRFHKVRCLLVGQVELDEVSPSCIQQLEQLVQTGHIEMIGQVPFKEAIEKLRQADLAWLPWTASPNNQLGIPRKLLEYMAAGLPVVASDFGFISEIVRDAHCGVLVPAEQSSAHAAAIEQLLQDREGARALGQSGRQAFRDRYNWQSEERKLLDFYQRLLQATDRRRDSHPQ